jgi:glycosyltransferase involved in cell wall biosynthesis
MNKIIYLSVVAPVYNEEENIESVIRYWNNVLDLAGFTSEIVVTNDGSEDKSFNILSNLQKEIPRLKVINHEINCGYGRALSTSIKNSSGEWVITIDSDGQFDLNEYKLLLEKAQSENLNVITGYRKKKHDTFIRVFCDRVLNQIVRLMFRVQLRDTNCALKLLAGRLIRNIDLEARGYPAPTEIVIKSSVLGAKLGEVGITHSKREGGLSKLNPIATCINFLFFLLYLKIKIGLYNKKILNTL